MPIRIGGDKKTDAARAVEWQKYVTGVFHPLLAALKNEKKAAFAFAEEAAADLADELQPIATVLEAAFERFGIPIEEFLEGKFANLTSHALAAVTGAITKHTNVTPDQVDAIAGEALADAYKFGISSFVVTALFEMLLPEKLNVLNGTGAFLSKLADFDEITEAVLGPIISTGIGVAQRYSAQSKFRPFVPNLGATTSLYARGLIDAATRDQLIAYAGLAPQYAGPEISAAYHGMSPRILLRLIETGLFTPADIADEQTFSGMRTVSQHRMLLAAPYLATQPMRSKLHSALEQMYVNGLISDNDFTAAIDQAEQNTDRDNLLLQAVKYQLLISETKKLETEYSKSFQAGVLDDVTYRSQLAGLGLQPGYIDIIAGVAEAAAAVTLRRQELRDAAALERATAGAERKAALAFFKAGTYDAAGLAAALTGTGLTATQVAAMVSLAQLQLGGSLRWVYGLELTTSAAQLLHARVTDLMDQRKKQLIDDTRFKTTLQDLGIGATWVNALTANANANITPKSAALVVPVETQ
jgi:hypothetical protein